MNGVYNEKVAYSTYYISKICKLFFFVEKERKVQINPSRHVVVAKLKPNAIDEGLLRQG